jgi:molybdenum cofactor cytidylyltransferase
MEKSAFNTKGNIAIILLAAGQSSRMKAIKQLLPWKGTTLLLHALNTILDIQKEKVFMVLGVNSALIQERLKLESYPVTLIKNEAWQMGLGSSIACGIDAILKQEHAIDGIVICLADQPLLTSSYYKELIRVFTSNNVPIVATRYPNKFGVPAIFKTEIAQELIHLKEDHGARYMMSKYKELVLALDAGDQIVDIDTPETYKRVYEQHNKSQE